MKLALTQQASDWFAIELAEHDNRWWWQETEWGGRYVSSATLADAGVEGTEEHMIGMADAIQRGGRFAWKHCAVLVEGELVFLWSPCGSRHMAECSLEEALAIAKEIRERFGVSEVARAEA